jgi:hypothetical protein
MPIPSILFVLHATGGYAVTIGMRLVATRVHLFATGRQLHEKFACSSGQLHAKKPVFASTL